MRALAPILALAANLAPLIAQNDAGGPEGSDTPAAGDRGDPDMLRFLNGDTLHGRFEGMDDSSLVKWSRSSIRNQLLLDSSKLRRMALNGGRAAKSLGSPAFVELTSGDRVPGTVTALDSETVTIDTEFAGTIAIPRKHVRVLGANPHGGSVQYVGPFSPEGWRFLPAPKTPGKEPAEPADDEESGGPWIFAGGAWYSNGQQPLALDARMPDKVRIRFRMAWRDRLSAVIAFHATTAAPEDDGLDEDAEGKDAPPGRNANSFARTYGCSYVLNLYTSYVMLYRCTFDEDGNAQMDRLSKNTANVRLGEVGSAELELRCDRTSGRIVLYVNGAFIGQWDDTNGYAGTGSHLAFASQNSPGRLRISDLVVSSWNGMMDSARSMDAENRDVVLLTNGTDRFSGQVRSLENGRVHLDGTFSEMRLPVSEVEEIRFARESRAALPEPSGDAVRALLEPVGRITFDPLRATRGRISGRSTALGEFNLDLGYARLLEFAFGDRLLDDWDDDF